MDYIEVHFQVEPQSTGTEILIAMLSQIGYESFLETDAGLIGYIQSPQFHLSALIELQQTIAPGVNFTFTSNIVKSQNWNEVWESNFNPVIIGGRVYVRAPFHEPDESIEFEIVIEPKMSFGTAHHETTMMMIDFLLEENLSEKAVLDMGCGTGILAILAEMLGAKGIFAIDNDEWAYNNALENVRKNKCKHISVFKGTADLLKHEKFDIVLANINRNVLLSEMKKYTDHLAENGVLILSGFYVDDIPAINQAVVSCGLEPGKNETKNDWAAVRFTKSPVRE
jgi:ribosomal protein L11 methyltransferase